jgi:hypothetical protein
MVRKSVPDSRRFTANACRSECGVTGLERPDNRCAFWQAASTASFVIGRSCQGTATPSGERRSSSCAGSPAAWATASRTIFATFTLLDANNHTGTIDGGGLQPDGLRDAQACRVAGGQDHPMFVAIHAAEEMHNFFRAQDDG